VYAEAMLLIDHGEREIAKINVVLKQCVSAYQQVNLATRQARKDVGAGAPAFATRENGRANPGRLSQRRNRVPMLAGKKLSRRHQGSLASGFDYIGAGEQGHYRFAGAHVALEEPRHPFRLAEIGDDVCNCAELRAGEVVGQGGDDPFAQRTVAGGLPATWAARVRAHQPKRELPGQEFIIGKPRPGGVCR
jgi:hypothetical protein